MTALPTLPEGVYYVANKGQHLMDHVGNLYAATPPTPPAMVKSRRGSDHRIRSRT